MQFTVILRTRNGSKFCYVILIIQFNIVENAWQGKCHGGGRRNGKHVRNWTESEARTHLHMCGPQRHKSCAFLSVAVFGSELARSLHAFRFAIDCHFRKRRRRRRRWSRRRNRKTQLQILIVCFPQLNDFKLSKWLVVGWFGFMAYQPL